MPTQHSDALVTPHSRANQNRIIQGDALGILKTLASESIDCVITSPPYFGLRDYGVHGQLGREATPALYIERIVQIFREVRRVLKDDGTLWLNLGDSYSVGGRGGGKHKIKFEPVAHGPKQLLGIPWRVALALQADGWVLRQDIIWHKPNPMPESVTDRCTKAHEYVFLLSKTARYHFDAVAIKEPATCAADRRRALGRVVYNGKRTGAKGTGQAAFVAIRDIRNKRSVWTVVPTQYKGAHFATFPEALVEPMVLAGCPKGGIVLDPFFGAGTTGVVARKLGRSYVGIELNRHYLAIARARIAAVRAH